MKEVTQIIIADDHPLLRRGVKELIEEQEGWQVIGEASDGEKALELANDRDLTSYKIIILRELENLRRNSKSKEILDVNMSLTSIKEPSYTEKVQNIDHRTILLATMLGVGQRMYSGPFSEDELGIMFWKFHNQVQN